MVTFREAGKMLDRAMEALPEGIFDGLNGGVNLLEEEKRDSRDGYILGLYHNNMMGRYIEIFYGSFVGLYGDIPAEQFERRLRSTLHHELTHHIEGLAGDRSLEHWDEEQELLWDSLGDEELVVGSILFVDDDDTALAPAAKALFEMYAAERCPDIPAESAGLFRAGDSLQPDCAAAVRALGGDLGGHSFKALDGEIFDRYDGVMCMTLAQMDELLDRFPGSEGKVFCADDTDILRPKLRVNWKKAVERVRAAVDAESGQLRMDTDMEILRLDAAADGGIIDGIARLEEENFSLPWTRDMIARHIAMPECVFFAAVRDGELLGYIGGIARFGELEIFNVAVDSRHRRQGVAKALVSALLEAAVGLERVSLEVRAGNAAAIALYTGLGFVQVGRRKNYYEKPREDALLMDFVPAKD